MSEGVDLYKLKDGVIALAIILPLASLALSGALAPALGASALAAYAYAAQNPVQYADTDGKDD